MYKTVKNILLLTFLISSLSGASFAQEPPQNPEGKEDLTEYLSRNESDIKTATLLTYDDLVKMTSQGKFEAPSAAMTGMLDAMREQGRGSVTQSILDNARQRLGIKDEPVNNYAPKGPFLPGITVIPVDRIKNEEKWRNDPMNTVPLLLPHAKSPVMVPDIEHIPYYFSDIRIFNNGDISVSETINFISKGEFFKDTLYKLFPYRVFKRDGSYNKLNFSIIETELDGKPLKYKLKKKPFGSVLEIGESGNILEKGLHKLRISYKVYNQVDFYKNFDELVWDITFSNWKMVTGRVGASVMMPFKGEPVSQTGFTGTAGFASQEMVTYVTKDNEVLFAAARPFAPGEGMTIVSSWSKGAVNHPSLGQRLTSFINNQGSAAIGFFGVIAVLGTYLISWLWFNQRAKNKKIIIRQTPPENMSPSMLKFIINKKIDKKSIISTILNIAQKGFIIIEEKVLGQISLVKISDNLKLLTADETKFITKIFGNTNTSVEINKAAELKFLRAYSALEKELNFDYKTKYFKLNQGYLLFGLTMFLFSLIGMSVLSLDPIYTLYISLWLAALLTAFSFIAVSFYYYFINNFIKNPIKSSLLNKIFKLSGFVFLLIILGIGSLMGLDLYRETTSNLAALSIPLMPLAIGIFYNLFKRPTALGLDIITGIKGFVLFLKNGNQSLSSLLTSAEKSSSIFYKNLSYSIAFDIKKDFEHSFENIQIKSPNWYSGVREEPLSVLEDLNKLIPEAQG